MTPKESFALWGVLVFFAYWCFILTAAFTGANLLSFFWLLMTILSAWEMGLALKRMRR